MISATRSEPGENDTPEAKLVNCLSSVAFPAVQAGVSTILCVCSLLFVKLYMSMVFVKTMVVCVVLCNIHGLIFLPAFLIIFDTLFTHAKKGVKKIKKKKQKKLETTPATVTTTNTNKRRIQPRDEESNKSVPDRPYLTPDPSPRPTPKPSPLPSPKPGPKESKEMKHVNIKDDKVAETSSQKSSNSSFDSRKAKLQSQKAVEDHEV